MSDHWYQPPPDACTECGEPADHPNHKRRCGGTFSLGGKPGFLFCTLEDTHVAAGEPHLARDWRGELHSIELDPPPATTENQA